MRLATVRRQDGSTRAVRVDEEQLVDLGAQDIGRFLAEPDWAARAAAASHHLATVDGADFAPVVPHPAVVIGSTVRLAAGQELGGHHTPRPVAGDAG